uniref:28 kDa salivary D7-related protein SP25 n=1 Tax=Phlebotomus argentipes TaxID=94469 RepID=Q0ZST1_PHLAR|nr:28 kDa salivary D7-related protein SP25 [Phlebotomus argentipes]
MKNLIRIIVAVISFLGLAHSLQFPRNADQTRWALKSCLREARPPRSLGAKWRELTLPKNERTFCFVQCLWTYLGIFDEKTRRFNTSAIETQFISRGSLSPKSLHTLKGQVKGKTCKEVYKFSIDFLKKYKSEFRHVFYLTDQTSLTWYSQNRGKVKGRDEKASSFCQKESNECERLHCRFYYYRLVDEDYKIIFFRKILIYGISNRQFNQCREEADKKNGCNVAKAFKECLEKIDNEKVQNAMEAWDYVSQRYA